MVGGHETIDFWKIEQFKIFQNTWTDQDADDSEHIKHKHEQIQVPTVLSTTDWLERHSGSVFSFNQCAHAPIGHRLCVDSNLRQHVPRLMLNKLDWFARNVCCVVCYESCVICRISV